MIISCVHQGYELYGSDRSFVTTVESIRAAFPEAEIEVVLPRHGPIVTLLEAAATRIVFEPLWVLRRKGLLRLATIGLTQLPAAILRAWRRLRRSDIVYVNTSVVADYMLASRLCPGKAILHVHEIPQGLTLALLRALVRWTSAEIVFNSRSTRDAFGLPAERPARVIYNGVAGPATAAPPTYDGTRPLRLLMLGRLSRIKGQEVLIEALGKLTAPVLPEVRIVGDAFEDDARAVRLGGLLRERGLSGHVQLLPFTPDPSEHYRWADIVAVPSRLPESLGRVAIEAMAFGRPPLASSIGGLREVVEHERSGWLVEPDSPDALARALDAIIDKPDGWRSYGAAARRRYEALFSEAAAASATASVLHDRLTSRRPRRRGPRRRAEAQLMRSRLGRLSQRFTVLLSGEAVQSAFNFGLNVALARVLTPACYGAFAIVMLVAGFAIIYMRALINVPSVAAAPQSGSSNRAKSFAVTFGSGAVAVSFLSTILTVAMLSIWEPGSALAGGLFVGAWALRSYVRMALSTQGRMIKAAGSDLGFALAASAFCVPLLYYEPKGLLQYVFLALAAAHLIGSLVAVAQQGERIRISFRRSIRRRFARLLPTMTWSIVSVTANNIQGQGGVFLLAILAGPAAYAPIAITMSFFTPLRLATSSVMYMMLPDLAENVARPGSRSFVDLFLAPMGLILLICGAYGLAMVLGFPSLARDALAGRFDGEPLDLIAVLNWCISTVAVLYAVPKLQLETSRQFKLTTGLAILGGALGLPLVALLLRWTTPAWSLCGILASELIILAGCLVFSYRSTTRHKSTSRSIAGGAPGLDLGQALSRRR